MNINLYTDAPYHNLALMKLSTLYKEAGDEVTLNLPIMPCDYSFSSILFEKNRNKFNADEYGGPAFESSILTDAVEKAKPDYSLYPTDYSLGYTFRPCYRKCSFCKVWKMHHPDTEHHSIWEFHDIRFKKICLLNNNTFFDKQWKETFEEIWDAGLIVRDENGYDLRLLDDEKADALHKTKFCTPLHFAWDSIKDEERIRRGFDLLAKHHLRTTSNGCYVLIGYDSTEEEDLHRCQVISDYGLRPYVMPYIPSGKRFKRFIDTFMWRKYKTIKEAWMNYKG
jgi:hypothetical protein